MKKTDSISRLAASFCLISLVWLMMGRVIMEGAAPFFYGFKISFFHMVQPLPWVLGIIQEMTNEGLDQLDTGYEAFGALLGIIAGLFFLALVAAGVCQILLVLFGILVGEKIDEERESPQVTITDMGNGISLKFDGFRESNQWTVFNKEGRVGDYESEDKAREVIDLLKGDLI